MIKSEKSTVFSTEPILLSSLLKTWFVILRQVMENDEKLYLEKGQGDVVVVVEDFYSAREGWKPNETTTLLKQGLHAENQRGHGWTSEAENKLLYGI